MALFDWHSLLPELQTEIRLISDPLARAHLAMTSRREAEWREHWFWTHWSGKRSLPSYETGVVKYGSVDMAMNYRFTSCWLSDALRFFIDYRSADFAWQYYNRLGRPSLADLKPGSEAALAQCLTRFGFAHDLRRALRLGDTSRLSTYGLRQVMEGIYVDDDLSSWSSVTTDWMIDQLSRSSEQHHLMGSVIHVIKSVRQARHIVTKFPILLTPMRGPIWRALIEITEDLALARWIIEEHDLVSRDDYFLLRCYKGRALTQARAGIIDHFKLYLNHELFAHIFQQGDVMAAKWVLARLHRLSFELPIHIQLPVRPQEDPLFRWLEREGHLVENRTRLIDKTTGQIIASVNRY